MDLYVNDVDNSKSELFWTYSFPQELTENENSNNNIFFLQGAVSNKINITVLEAVPVNPGEALPRYTTGKFLSSGGDTIFVNIDEATHVTTITTTQNLTVSNFPIEFTVVDPYFLSDSDTTQISIIPVNDAPMWTQSLPEINMFEDDSTYFAVEALKDYLEDVDTPFDSLHIVIKQPLDSKIILELIENNAILKFKGTKDYFGIESFILQVDDGIVTIRTTFSVNVKTVNYLHVF